MMRNYPLRSRRQTFEFYDFHPEPADIFAEASVSLQKSPKTLSPKFFYDERGSRLFDQICKLPEYYLTRSETQLLKDKAGEIVSFIGETPVILEYGCGSSEKIHHLLDAALSCEVYAAIDISKSALLQLSTNLEEIYPQLQVVAICADFFQEFQIPLGNRPEARKLAFFPGSSIGNFDPEQAQGFLRKIARQVGSGGGLLIGVDLKKDAEILHAAYNDAQGVTAEFNKNILRRMNHECGSNFDLSQFEHWAFYNEAKGRIEMHLVSLKKQNISFNGIELSFEKGESIHSENSYKYAVEEFQALAEQAGWKARQYWLDDEAKVSMHFFEAL